MFCERCGAETPEDARFCEQCGTDISSAKNPAADVPPEAPRRGNPFVSALVALVLFVLLLASVGLMAFVVAGGALPWTGASHHGMPAGEDADANRSEKPDSGESREIREGASYDEISAAVGSRKSVRMEHVSTDVSEYPLVKAYFSVRDDAGKDVSLDHPAVAVREGIAGGGDAAREVRSFAHVDGREGISISLVADKSGSMDFDLPEVKSILTKFVRGLDFAHGDEAQLIAFDNYVMYMCSYSNSEDRLTTGISNMEPYGQTALYDALRDAVRDAGDRRGARCVVAFTDGADNVSTCGASEVEKLARDLSVPVYVIGTHRADKADLEPLAKATGGRYWDISGVRELGNALDAIAEAERSLYCVEYVSDESVPADARRRLSCVVVDDALGCEAKAEVTPVAVGGDRHPSRYEVVKEDISWTDANVEAMRKGGHLVTIGDQEEMDLMSQMAEDAGLQFAWMGGYTSTRGGSAFGHWVTGEPFDYQSWYPGEPSRNDHDGTPEMYLMLWRVKGVWSWNDERNAPYEESSMDYMQGKVGYIIEYEDAA